VTEHNPITDEDINGVTRWLEEALSATNPEARHERVGRAVRALTRVWAAANADFDGDAWYPISWMLTEHWDQIRGHMANAETD
jgi:hypothetical protein